ncbi:MAG: hypothetical protein ACREBR_00170 [bacterium]
MSDKHQFFRLRINHGNNSSGKKGWYSGEGNGSGDVNVKLQWSKCSHINDAVLTKLTPKELREREETESGLGAYGISMELVAIRDIVEGEEILLDYDPDWMEAWSKYSKSWIAPDSAKKDEFYVTAAQYNERNEPFRNKRRKVVAMMAMTTTLIQQQLKKFYVRAIISKSLRVSDLTCH